MSDRWATFDCYGTLVDWNGGLWTEFATVWPEANTDRLLELYHHVEPLIEEDGDLTYDEVLVRALAAVGAIAGEAVPIGREHALAESLPSWPTFPEVPGALSDLRGRGWKLAALSNTDPELLATSIEAIGVPFDISITASEAGSYKPAPGHWERFFADTGADRARHVHVAASLFHDIAPASRMGMKAVWINRLQEESDLPRAAELPDLTRLPDTLDELVAE
jgi:2-haloacid dehalogenase